MEENEHRCKRLKSKAWAQAETALLTTLTASKTEYILRTPNESTDEKSHEINFAQHFVLNASSSKTHLQGARRTNISLTTSSAVQYATHASITQSTSMTPKSIELVESNGPKHSTVTHPTPQLKSVEFLPKSSKALQHSFLPPSYPVWTPSDTIGHSDSNHPFKRLISDDQKVMVKQYCQGPPQTVIVRSSRNHDISVSIDDFRDLLTPTSPIFHELLVLGLENACQIYQGAYL